jgi:serine/threonine protein phosphatase 1
MELIYAIPDIHGRLDLLCKAYEVIEEHAAGRPARIVFLGDAIDRGPDSKGCIDRLIKGTSASNFLPQINLLGNHEEFMMDVLNGKRSVTHHWLENGGIKTIASYGVHVPPLDTMDDWQEGFIQLVAATNGLNIPDDHMKWLNSLLYYYETDTHIFVHAGLFPGYSLQEILEKEKGKHQLIWIRRPFLDTDYDFGKHVIHGHSIRGKSDRRPSAPFRTNLDNGAYFTGCLHVGVVETHGHPTVIEVTI